MGNGDFQSIRCLYTFGTFRDKANIIIQQYEDLVAFPLIPQELTFSSFYVKFCFYASTLSLKVSVAFDDYCVQSNKDILILSATQMFSRESLLAI